MLQEIHELGFHISNSQLNWGSLISYIIQFPQDENRLIVQEKHRYLGKREIFLQGSIFINFRLEGSIFFKGTAIGKAETRFRVEDLEKEYSECIKISLIAET